MKKYFGRTVIIVLVLLVLGALLRAGGGKFFSGDSKPSMQKDTVLHMELEGVIMNGKRFLKNLKEYAELKQVKAVVVSINSPGGAVGPSQEVYGALKKVRDVLKKPLICVSTGIMASGAYYAAVACDKIIVAPGAMVGSIGVIMEFINLEKLYDWAKVSRYTITSGRFKDSGAEYRSMRDDERALFQEMINEVYAQFRNTVMEGRKLSKDVMDQYADGRVFTGSKAVELGFADQVGMFEDAVKVATDMAGIPEDSEVYEIPKKKRSIFDFGDANEDDPVNAVSKVVFDKILKTELANKPLYLMPGYWGESN